MRNDSSNDINHDLSKDFMLMHSFYVFKSEIKKKYMEACKMAVKEMSQDLVNDGVGGLLDTQGLIIALQSELNQDTGEDSNIVAISIDTGLLSSIDFVLQFVFCANGKSYKRLLTLKGVKSKFVLQNGGQK